MGAAKVAPTVLGCRVSVCGARNFPFVLRSRNFDRSTHCALPSSATGGGPARGQTRFTFSPLGRKLRFASVKPSAAALIRAAFRSVRARYLHKAKERGSCLSLLLGAGNRTRTGTLFTARDFKSLVSTDFTMPAR